MLWTKFKLDTEQVHCSKQAWLKRSCDQDLINGTELRSASCTFWPQQDTTTIVAGNVADSQSTEWACTLNRVTNCCQEYSVPHATIKPLSV